MALTRFPCEFNRPHMTLSFLANWPSAHPPIPTVLHLISSSETTDSIMLERQTLSPRTHCQCHLEALRESVEHDDIFRYTFKEIIWYQTIQYSAFRNVLFLVYGTASPPEAQDGVYSLRVCLGTIYRAFYLLVLTSCQNSQEHMQRLRNRFGHHRLNDLQLPQKKSAAVKCCSQRHPT